MNYKDLQGHNHLIRKLGFMFLIFEEVDRISPPEMNPVPHLEIPMP